MKKTIMITILDTKRYANGNMNKPVHEFSPMETFAAYIRCAGDKEKAGYIEELLAHGSEYLESTEIVFDEVTRSDTMFFDREKHYIKISDNVTMQREMCEKAEATGLTESEVKTIKQQ